MLQSLWRGLFAPSAISYAIVFGETDPPSFKVERVVLNALQTKHA